MRYVEARHLRGTESFWLRLRFALSLTGYRTWAKPVDISRLNDHLLRDIGVRETRHRRGWQDRR
jgi:hypothetical protein